MILERLATLAGTYPRRTLLGWAVLLGLAVPVAIGLPGRLVPGGGLSTGTEAYGVQQTLKHDFEHPPGEPWIVVWRGQQDPAVVKAVAAELRALPGAAEVLAPTDERADARLTGVDGHGGSILVSMREETPEGLAAVREAATALSGPGRDVATTGSYPIGRDMLLAARSDTQRAERLSVLPVLVVLYLAFGSAVAAALPLLLAFGSILLASALGSLLAPVMGLGALFPTIVTLLGMALGTDYALLLTARFREGLREGRSPLESATLTGATAGRTVACAGGVVIASLAALLPFGILDARSIGMGGVCVVASAVVLALGMLPALLVLLAKRLDRPARPAPWARWGEGVLKRRWPLAIAATALLAVLAAPLASLKIEAPDLRFYPTELEAVHGVQLLADNGRRGWTAPVQVLVSRADGGPILRGGGLGPLIRLSREIGADPRVGEVLSAVDVPGMKPVQYAVAYAPPDVMQRFPALSRVVSRDGRTALLHVIAKNDVDVSGLHGLSARIRGLHPDGLEVRVGGLPAANLDYDARLARVAPPALAGLLLVTALLLGLTFRAVLVPLKAIALNLAVVAASVGALVWVFQEGHGLRLTSVPGPLGTLPSLVPVLVFCLTFGLSMDYEVFMIGRVREERRAARSEDAAITGGLAATGGVIAAAAFIMVLVCAAFGGAHTIFVRLFGTGMALAILLDVTVVRLVLAPALLSIAGRWNWWPGNRVDGITSPSEGIQSEA